VRLAKVQLLSEDTSGIASASAQFAPDESAANAFDGLTGTKWFNDSAGSNGWLQFKFGGGAAWALSEYGLTSANDVPERDPSAWQFQASNDGTNWTNLDKRTNQTFATRLQSRAYAIANTTPYRIYRLNITKNRSGDSLQLAELDLGPGLAPATAPVTPNTVASPAMKYLTPAEDALSGAFSPTALSGDTIAWGQGKCIWSMNLNVNDPNLLLDLRKGAPSNSTLRSFSYSAETGHFLLRCAQNGRDSFWYFDPNDPASGVRQLRTREPVQDAVWLKGGNKDAWVGREGAFLVSARDANSIPVRIVSFARVDAFNVAPDGGRLFMFGAPGNEPAAGLWRYDLASSELKAVAPYADYPSAYAKPMSHTSGSVRLPGRNLNYDIFPPPNVDHRLGHKYPLVIGNTVFGIAVNGAHGRLWIPAIASCGAYVVVVNRADWWRGIEQWGENVTAVCDQVEHDLPIDRNRVFLFGASAETEHMSKFMTNSPAFWKGAIFLNPTQLPDFSKSPLFQNRPKILISAGTQEHEEARLKKYQQDALNCGVLVDFELSAGEGHHFIGNAGQLERATAMRRFIFDE